LNNGVASLAYDPLVHAEVPLTMDCRVKSGHDENLDDPRSHLTTY
jgi:hypothetical protein